MNTLTLIQDLLLESQQGDHFTGTVRRLPYRLVPGKALACIGVRRCGKSTLLHQIIQRLQEAGTPSDNILYVNFFDDRLDAVRRGQLHLITEAYFGLYPEKRGQTGLHVFLDEIQMCSGWEGFVDRLLRVEKMNVYFSGSSARLLAQEVGTAMRGRALSWELFPFSFAEYLDSRVIPVRLQGQANRLRVRKAFADYWECGGFPEVLDADPGLRVMIHQDYFKTMIYRDVIDRADAIHPQAVRDIAYRLINSVSSCYTINSMTAYLKSLGHKVSKSFVGEMIEWFEDAYALFSVKRYDASLHKQQVNPRKIYAVDHAMVKSVSTGILVNRGHLLENLVFIDGRRRGRSLYYYRTSKGREVDFVWKQDDGALTFVQVCEEMPEGSPTRERELLALREACAEHPRSRAVVVTRDEEFKLHDEAGVIEGIPVWKWLLEDNGRLCE